MSGLADQANQNYLSLAALVISCVALVTTVLQVLQQYFSSAEGYRRCAPSVMGKWSDGTHRKLRWHEFRIEVVFEAPVILTARPENKKGPIKKKPLYALTGTPQSYHDTLLLATNEQEKQDTQTAERIHTADDERASWLTLLTAIQDKENASREWDRETREESIYGKVNGAPDYTLVVQIQRKTRSWDFISSNITKPYATSAICHLVEMMAMLGLYWKAFDQSLWNLRAEGNGYIVTSTHVHGLGVMVVFATTGKSKYPENRVIPCIEIKDLAFGTVANIFEEEAYLKQKPDAQSLELVFGSDDDVSNTLESLGCQAETLMRYKKDHKHIFSVSFEIIGMLGSVFRIRWSNFRMIPNPTADPWLRKVGKKDSWKIIRLMEVFYQKLLDFVLKQGLRDDQNPNSENLYNRHICSIVDAWDGIAPDCTDEANLSLDAREAIHNALDRQTEFLLTFEQADVLSVVVAHVTKVVEVLADPISPLNTIILANKEDALFSYYFSKIRPVVVGDSEQEKRNVLWVSLIFRMLCWLLLHDFDKADMKIVPSDLKGSRMPIYIG